MKAKTTLRIINLCALGCASLVISVCFWSAIATAQTTTPPGWVATEPHIDMSRYLWRNTDIDLIGGTSLTIQAGGNPVVTIQPDGKVTWTGDIDESAKKFWNAVGQNWPIFKESIIAGYKAAQEEERAKTTRWQADTFRFNGEDGKIGLRSDGVLVWQKASR